MKEINSFILYHDWYLLFKNLPLETKGILLDTIFLYVKGEITLEAVNPVIEDIFVYISTYIDRDREKYIEKCKKMEENARKRYEKKQEQDKKKNGFAGYDFNSFEKSLDSD